MPTTTPDGFPYEVPGAAPGITLHGGLSGAEDILAEKVQDKVTSMDADIATLQSRVTALENGTGGVGWMPIASGSDSGGSFTIDLTNGGKYPSPPLWNSVKLLLRFDLTGTEDLRMRVNGDSTSFYTSAFLPLVADGSFGGTPEHHTSADSWIIGRAATISTNNLELTLFHTGANPGLLNFQATCTRMSTTQGVMLYEPTWGYIQSSGLTATSLEIFTEGAETFTNAWWWATGLRMEHPS